MFKVLNNIEIKNVFTKKYSKLVFQEMILKSKKLTRDNTFDKVTIYQRRKKKHPIKMYSNNTIIKLIGTLQLIFIKLKVNLEILPITSYYFCDIKMKLFSLVLNRMF